MFYVLVTILVTFTTPGGLVARGFQVELPKEMYGKACHRANQEYRAELGAMEGYRFEWSNCAEELKRRQ